MDTLILVLMGGLVFGADPSQEGPPSALGLDALRARLLETQQRISGMHVIYESDSYDDRFPDGSYVRTELKAQAPGFLWHCGAHGHDAVHWTDDPYQQVAIVGNQHLWNVFPIDHAFFQDEIKPKDPLPGSLKNDFFFLATGIWPLYGRKEPPGGDCEVTLREIASSEKYDQVLARQESVSGRWCHVLEYASIDRLWLDTERGALLMKRELCDASTGILRQRFTVEEVFEVGSGLWGPRRIRVEKFSDSGDELRNSLVHISHLDFEDQEAGTFDFSMAPGMIEIPVDLKSKPVQVAGGGGDHAHRLTSWLERVHGLSVPPKTTNSGLRLWALFGLGALGLVLLLEGLLRLRIGRNSRPDQMTQA